MKNLSILTLPVITNGYIKYLFVLKLITIFLLVNLMPASALPVAPFSNPVLTNATEGTQKQKITGVVTDAETKEPLIGVTVLSVTSKGVKYATVTDNKGKFTIDASDSTTTLFISYMGYEKQEIKLGNKSFLSIELKSQSTTLDEIVVSWIWHSKET